MRMVVGADVGNDTINTGTVVILSNFGSGEVSSEILGDDIATVLLCCSTCSRAVDVGLERRRRRLCDDGWFFRSRWLGRFAGLGSCEGSEFGSGVVVGGDGDQAGSWGFITL
jgi:hypothetical protein